MKLRLYQTLSLPPSPSIPLLQGYMSSVLPAMPRFHCKTSPVPPVRTVILGVRAPSSPFFREG